MDSYVYASISLTCSLVSLTLVQDQTCLCWDLWQWYVYPHHPVLYSKERRIPDFNVLPDLHEYLTGPTTIPATPHPITGATLPVTLGHEFSGVVEEIGLSVTKVKVGDRVVVKPNLYDG